MFLIVAGVVFSRERPGFRPDGRRTSGQTVVGGARVVSGAENHLIEAAPFGRLDQMLRTIVYEGGLGGSAS